jgi:predicted RNA binding protein with dsRBD fold (UPF0201 family)
MPLITAITARATCHPTEDCEKVRQALLNVFPDSEIEASGDELVARTDSGERLREIILNQHIRDTARSVILHGREGNRTRFLINKQVAFVGKVSFLEGPVPLGGIQVEVEAEDLSSAIDYLAESTVEVKP